MAGIGFTLRKIMSERRLSSVAVAAIAGLFIVAGPWFFSMVNMAIVAGTLGSTSQSTSGQELFFAFTIYGYALSLIFSAPIHYLLTRIVADLVFENREAATTRYLVQFIPLVIFIGLACGSWVISLLSGHPLAQDPVFISSYLLFCVGINITWLALINASLLRWYKRMLAAFLLVLGCSILAMMLGPSSDGLARSMLVMGLGNFSLGTILTILCILAYPLQINRREHRTKAAFEQSWPLILGGWFLSLDLWLEKIYYWFMKGLQVEGTRILTHPAYDHAIYLSNLSIIPAMVFFLVFTETDFSSNIRRFLNGLGTLPYTALHKRKLELMNLTRRSLWTLVLVQGLVSAGLFFAGPWIMSLTPDLTWELWTIGLSLAWLQFLVLSWFNLYFYFGRQFRVLFSACFLLVANLILTAGFHQFLPELPDGLGAVIAHALTVILLYRELMYTTEHADRIILSGNN